MWYQSWSLEVKDPSMTSTKVDLEKFNGKNDFNMWKVNMEAVLITHGLGDALLPITKKEGKDVSTSKTPEQMAEIDRKAKGTIILSLADSVIREVAKEPTVADLWAKLESIYMKKSLANRLYIKKRMFTLKMHEGSSLDEHLDEFNKVCDTLETIDAALEDEDKALLLISSLPKSYEHFIDALMYGRQTLSLDEVKSALSTKELQGKQESLGNSSAVVEEEGYESAGVCVATESTDKGKWVLDSGCTFHMCPYKNYLTEYHDLDGGRVMMGNNAMCKIISIGNIRLKLHDETIRELKQVRFVPELKRNLISLGMLDQMGYSVKIEYGEMMIIKGTEIIMKGLRKNGVFVLDGKVVTGEVGVSVDANTDKTRLWHLRLGHIGVRGLKELDKQGLLEGDKISDLEFCESCVLGKTTRASFNRSIHKSNDKLEYVHSDLWGPSQQVSLGGNSYFLSIIDDYSRRVWVYTLKSKDQVFEKFFEWKNLVENQCGKNVKKLRTDNGLEFCNQKFDSFCAKEGIARHKTVRLTPQQNGLAERMNRTLMERVRSMLVQSKLPKTLWAEILLTACHLVNLSPSTAIEFKTPYERWTGQPANYGNLRAFGCPAYAHTSQGKLAPRALKGLFIGYPEGVKGYKIWCTDLSPPRCIISRDVTFNEKELLNQKSAQQPTKEDTETGKKQQFEVELSRSDNSLEAEDSGGVIDSSRDPELPQQEQESQGHEQGYQLTRDRAKRQIKQTRRYGYADLISYALAAAHQIDEDEPKIYKEAVQNKFSKEWQQAMDEEILSLYKNNTWELVKKLDKRRVVDCKWIFKVKDGLTGDEPKRFKARLVAKGYTQKEGVDFNEVFSPVVRHASIRVILALTAVQDIELDQLDVKTAFLHGRLQEEIFMTQPEGYVDSMKPRHVCLLKKSLYGLKQSPRQWYLRFDEFMITNGLMRCNYDCCVYFKLLEDDLYIYLLLNVDDMLIACKRRDEIEKLKVMLNSEFDMKDLGTAKKILGVEIKRNRTKGEIFLSQERYLTKVLETYKMLDSKPVLTPLAAHFKLSNQLCPKTDEEKLDMKNVPYANVVGCLMYAMVLTRPDLSHSVSVVSRYMAQPVREHWRAVRWIMRYLNGSLSHGLHVVALSTTEAVKEALWLQGLLGELGVRQKSVTIHCDSSSAIHLCKNPAHHERTKHIDIKLHFIINEVSKGAVKMAKVHTDENPADMLTKAVPSAKFNICLDLAGLSSL
ncbi:Integrase catalytic domain-containing protein [Citrus sinensis]|uniref:Integrase catalytic domain-containing protein n=1 Tax=Citrus sinensis TaxID=2711 RepID=A0ACB8ICZ5_CITSI|nr:Integrase catalytic domain-containing protein [Citrus sinensis]